MKQTLHLDRCIVCQEEGKEITASGNAFRHSGSYGIKSYAYAMANEEEKFCDECFEKVESRGKSIQDSLSKMGFTTNQKDNGN